MSGKRKWLRRGAGAATTAVALVVSLGLPVTAQAKVDGHEFEVEVHAESEDASLTDGRNISTDTGYGLGVNATNGHTATINVGNVTATASGYGRAAELRSRNGAFVEATLGDVDIGGSGYVKGLVAAAFDGGATSVTAGNITNTVEGNLNGSCYGLQASASTDGALAVTVKDVTSADDGIDVSADGDNARATIATGNVSAGEWNKVSASGSTASLLAKLGNVSSEKNDGLTVQARYGGFTEVYTGEIKGANKALSIVAYGGSGVVAETGNLISTGTSHYSGGIYAQGGSGKNGDFVMVNVDGDIYANGTGIAALQAGKYLVDGDVTSVESDGVSFGDGSEQSAVLITGTLSAGRNAISGLSNADVRDNADLTVWKISAGDEMFYGDDGTFAAKTNYIVKVKEGQENLATVTREGGEPLKMDFGYNIARQDERLRVTVADTGDECKKYVPYNGVGADKTPLEEDKTGYYLDVEAGGGIYISVEEEEDHDYGFKEMVWSGSEDEGYEVAAGHFVCSKVSYHDKYQDATLTKVVTQPECTKEGFTTFTATLTADESIDGKEHTDTRVALKTPATGHKESERLEENRVEPTCEKPGSFDEVVYCTICNEELSREKITIPATGHDWDEGKVTKEATCTEEGVKTYTCKHDPSHTRTETIPKDPDNHTWKRGVVTKEPTCSEEGEMTYTCANDASHFYTETIPIDEDAHDWDEGKVTKEPTCTEKGEKTFTCKNDSSHTKTEEIAALGHDWDEGKVTKEATCTKEGEKTYTCKHDPSHTRTETIPIDENAHDWDDPVYAWQEDNSSVFASRTCKNSSQSIHVDYESADTTAEVVKEPGCIEKGLTVYTAEFKNSVFETQKKTVETDAKGHDWGEWTVTKPATDTEEGEERRICKNDPSHVETRVIPVKEHKHGLTKVEAKDPTCTGDGNIAYWICTEGEKPCGRLFADEEGKAEISEIDTIVKATGHKEGTPVYENVKEATCDSDGSRNKVVYCTICNAELSRTTETIPKLGHDWDEGKVTKEATCTKEGEKTYTCKHDPSHTRTETIPIDENAHDWDDPVYAWQEDNSSVFASRTCKNSSQSIHVDYESADTTAEVVKEPGCTEKGLTVYTAEFENPAFETQKKTVETEAKGHDWQGATYVWSDDDTTLTATRMCSGCELTETETVTTEKKVIKEPTFTEEGEMEITGGGFENSAFEKQTKTVKIPKKTEAVSYRCISGDGNVWTKGSEATSDFTFVRSVDDETTFDHFTAIYVDEKKLNEGDAVLEKGSLVVKLKKEFLETLSVGQHTIRAEFNDGEAEAGFSIVAKAEPGNDPRNDPKNDPENGKNNDKKQSNNASGEVKNTAATQSKSSSSSGAVVVQSTTAKAAPATGDSNINGLWALLAVIPAGIIAGVIVRRRRTQR